MNIKQIQESRELHGIDEWSAGYFGIDEQGDVTCHPEGTEHLKVSLPEIVRKAQELNSTTPMILRFPQIIKNQVKRMHEAFSEATWEYNYAGKHLGVFPFKVNQRREFIDAIVESGREYDWGLEVGSKTELMAAMTYTLTSESLLICNGFKDDEFIEMAFIASKMGKKVLLVVEGPDELQLIINRLKDEEKSETPDIGIRVRLYSKGSGKWEKSSGETSKFGLTTIELLHALNMIENSDLKHKLKMLHFHIGSQITAIKRFKNALKEAARVYSKVCKMGFTPEFLNIGGGVGVDYDGSKTSAQSSANYSMQEFANDAVYVIGNVCDNEKIKHPNIVTESGRIIAAYHSIVVADIREVQGDETLESVTDLELLSKMKKTHKNITELQYVFDNINKKNYAEFYHDAVEYHEELFTLFTLGYLPLKERAIAEEIFHKIGRKALYFSSFERHRSEEFESLEKLKVSKYLANFSIFQSIPDSWAIGQLFPVIPLLRHDEKPSIKATIVDITCDSDGCLDRFIDRTENKTVLDLHPTSDSNSPYWIGFFLVGAYQESLANEHNLFGAINEAEVYVDEGGKWKIKKLTPGDPIDELLTCRNYDKKSILKGYKDQLKISEKKQNLTKSKSDEIYKKLNKYLSAYPYLCHSKTVIKTNS